MEVADGEANPDRSSFYRPSRSRPLQDQRMNDANPFAPPTAPLASTKSEAECIELRQRLLRVETHVRGFGEFLLVGAIIFSAIPDLRGKLWYRLVLALLIALAGWGFSRLNPWARSVWAGTFLINATGHFLTPGRTLREVGWGLFSLALIVPAWLPAAREVASREYRDRVIPATPQLKPDLQAWRGVIAFFVVSWLANELQLLLNLLK